MITIQQLPTLSDIKSVRSIGATSIPKIKRPTHLDLYVLGMEKSRLEKELAALNKRRNTVKNNLSGVNNQIEKLQKQTYEQQKNRDSENTPQKPLKTLTVDY
jgi:predicted  nucleic acid-binding Zn-ribbon protein